MQPFILILSEISFYLSVSYAGFGETIIEKKCFRSLVHSETCNENSANYSQFPELPVATDLFGTVCCYGEFLDCFNNDLGTIWGCLIQKPRCIKSLKPEFIIFSPDLTSYQIVHFFNLTRSIGQLRLNKNRKFYIIIHGYGNEWPKWWMKPMVELLTSRQKANVMVLRWSISTQTEFQILEYFKAVANMRSLAAAVAKILNALIAQRKVHLHKVAIIGYSLGAHMAGLIGARIPGIPTIFGLDPAGPMFTCHDPMTRLDPSDADRVVVLHTNGDNLANGGLGTMQPMGSLDVYVNGGKFQPNCPKRPAKDLSDLALEGIQGLNETLRDIMCSHAQAMKLFLKLLNRSDESGCIYSMVPCNSHEQWENGKCTCPDGMGNCPMFTFSSINEATGKYFLSTQSENGFDDCGTTAIVSLVPNANVKGLVTIVLKDSIGNEQIIAFQKPTGTLKAKVSNDKAFVLRPNIKDIETITIKYEKGIINTARSRNYAARNWKLIDCHIVVLDGHKYSCEKSATMSQEYSRNMHLQSEASYEL